MSSSAWIGSYWPCAALLMPIESCSRAARRSRIGRKASGGAAPPATPPGAGAGVGVELRSPALVHATRREVGDRHERDDHARTARDLGPAAVTALGLGDSGKG